MDVATERAPVMMGRARAAQLAAGAVAACTVVALADPADGGRYPACPTAVLLGWDCPACGTLRGVHALTRGRLVDALDHNLLLAVAIPMAIVVWLRWVLRAAGRAPQPVRVPTAALTMAVVVSVVFAILRNLPISSLSWLDAAS